MVFGEFPNLKGREKRSKSGVGKTRGKHQPKYVKNPYQPQTQTVLIGNLGLFFHFGHSKPLKQPKSPQMFSQNCSKTTGSNDLGPMPNHFF